MKVKAITWNISWNDILMISTGSGRCEVDTEQPGVRFVDGKRFVVSSPFYCQLRKLLSERGNKRLWLHAEPMSMFVVKIKHWKLESQQKTMEVLDGKRSEET